MRWEEIGWQLGKIADIITDATPRLFKSGFNFCIIWADKHKGPAKLAVSNYTATASTPLIILGSFSSTPLELASYCER